MYKRLCEEMEKVASESIHVIQIDKVFIPTSSLSLSPLLIGPNKRFVIGPNYY